jgi:hypothetical protein
MGEKRTVQEKNGVIVEFIEQDYDKIKKIYTRRHKFEYVGEGSTIGVSVKFLVDIPGRKANEVFWCDHTRRLCESSNLLIICSEEQLNEIREKKQPKQL